MGVQKFTRASGHNLRWSTLATALQNVSDGPWTAAVLFKRDSFTVANYHALTYLASGGGATTRAGFSLSGAVPQQAVFTDVTTGSQGLTPLTGFDKPYLTVTSKGAGSVAPTVGFKFGRDGSFTHETFTTVLADQAAADTLAIGEWPPTPADFWAGWIGIVGWWEGAMSAAQKEELGLNWRTTDFLFCSFGAPLFLAELNVAGASVVDFMGNASGLTNVGPSLDANETLDEWAFDAAAPASLPDKYNYSDFSKPLQGAVAL